MHTKVPYDIFSLNANDIEIGNYDLHERIWGSLYGLAVGDQFASTFEFISANQISEHLGKLRLNTYAEGSCATDDTQMSIFTLEALIHAFYEKKSPDVSDFQRHLSIAYHRWLLTQGRFNLYHFWHSDGIPSSVALYKVMHNVRMPGINTINALERSSSYKECAPNDSNGNGAIMRVAPIGLVAALKNLSDEVTFEIGAASASITHGHRTAHLSAGYLCTLIKHLVLGKTLANAMEIADSTLQKHDGHQDISGILQLAVGLCKNNTQHIRNIHSIGGGWQTHDCLAIAIYSCIFATNFMDAISTASTHDGDSDTVACVTGAIAGIIFGFNGIPFKYVRDLELYDVLKLFQGNL